MSDDYTHGDNLADPWGDAIMNNCPFCDFGSTYEYEQNDHFQYGAGEDAVMLCARVVVIACSRCSEKYTDWRGEDARDAAVNKYLDEKKGTT